MKKLKSIINEIRSAEVKSGPAYNSLLWQIICYSPKMPVRFQQQQLLDEAEKFSLAAFDPQFSKGNLIFNGFIWGKGKTCIILTHGWASKAADFSDLITALRNIPDTTIIAFDAPGNGSSEGELSDMPLYARALKAVITEFGAPDVLIGHSLGTFANMVTLKETGIIPKLLIGLTPLIRLKEKFEATMNSIEVPREAQQVFFRDFEKKYNDTFKHFTANQLYQFNNEFSYWIAYDEHDQIAPYAYLQEFLSAHPEIEMKAFNGAGHDKILKDPDMIESVVKLVSDIS